MSGSPAVIQSVPVLSMADFKRLARFIHSTIGIKMPDRKKSLVEARLRKRLKNLEMNSYSQYTNYFFSKEGFKNEQSYLINAITTNKTDFFREPKHFTYLTEKVLPQLMTAKKTIKQISVWSSACSTGDEPYTLAMVLEDYFKHTDFNYTITATDISSKVLNIAAQGVYTHESIEPVPLDFRKKYLLRSKDTSKNRVRVAPHLRSKVTFKRLNLMQAFDFLKKFDVVFCRNVIIYFDKPTTQVLMQRICEQIRKDGFLFMGHSELLDHQSLPVKPVASTIYQKL